MRVALNALIMAVLAVCLSSCGGGGQPKSETTETIQLACIPKSTGGEFWETVEAGARRAAGELNVEIKWEGTVTETEIAEQNKIIENMINLGVDGIALAPLNRRAQKKLAESAVEAGIPVVIFDSGLDGDAHTSFVATDNKEGGVKGARHMIDLLGGAGRVMVMRYVQGTGSTEARAEGFIATATAAGLEVVADPYPETGTVEGSKNVAVNTLEGFVKEGRLDLDGLFACNLYSTLGVVSALDDLRKSGIEVDLKFIGFDTSKKLIEELMAGGIQALVAQNPDKMGYLAVRTIYQVVKGQPVPKVIDTGVELITADRVNGEPAIRKLVGLE